MRKGSAVKICILTGGIFIPLLLLLLISAVTSLGGSGSNIYVPADEETVAAYQAICAETGVPWDVALMADVMLANQQDMRIEDMNPLFTSLQFCILTVNKQIAQEVEKKENGKLIVTTEWKDAGNTTYTGTEEICDYIGVTAAWLSGISIEKVLEQLQETCENTGDNTTKYSFEMSVNDNFNMVLTALVGLTDKNCNTVLSLHDSQYLAQLYGYIYNFGDLNLLDLVVGDVSRDDLARMAGSLLGHPYLLGGKSPYQGAPKGPLDCSGFVDWVYIQCFGTGVSGGGVPAGITMSGTALQWYASTPITAAELQIGDLAFLQDPAKLASGKTNHVGIYIGDVNGTKYFIHCAGRYYGTENLPNGRVGISKLSGSNDYNPITGEHFTPAMPACGFRYFRRPNFAFRE